MTKCLFNGLTEKLICLLALQEDNVCVLLFPCIGEYISLALFCFEKQMSEEKQACIGQVCFVYWTITGHVGFVGLFAFSLVV